MSTTLTETPAQLLKLHPKDNVAVALKPLAAKTTLAFEGQTITLLRIFRKDTKSPSKI